MSIKLWDQVKEPWVGFSRRDLFRQGGMLAAAQALGGSIQRVVAAPLEIGANMYRSIGVRPIFNERTAMAYVLAGPGDDGPLGTRVVAEATRRHNVPLVVDAAAEILTVKPNVHLDRGANVVAYSGGKCMRGPQAAGMLLGEKKYLQAAWINSAPH